MNLKDLVGETTLNNMEQITQGLKLLELIEKLPIGLILQHIRDSFSEDKPLMSVEAQMKTTKCIEDLMELQKLLEESKNNGGSSPAPSMKGIKNVTQSKGRGE